MRVGMHSRVENWLANSISGSEWPHARSFSTYSPKTARLGSISGPEVLGFWVDLGLSERASRPAAERGASDRSKGCLFARIGEICVRNGPSRVSSSSRSSKSRFRAGARIGPWGSVWGDPDPQKAPFGFWGPNKPQHAVWALSGQKLETRFPTPRIVGRTPRRRPRLARPRKF